MQARLPKYGNDYPLNASQKAFSSALLNANMALPANVTGPATNKKAEKRFGVYRNNVIVSLTEALMNSFPTIVALVGEDYFRSMARLFVMEHPPKSARIAIYGSDFGDFLDMFEPVRNLPYLGDVARLEFAWTNAYNAADQSPLDPASLQDVNPDQLANLVFNIHPATRILSCNHAACSIWAAHRQAESNNIKGGLVDRPEDILITRPHWDVTVVILPAGGYAFIKALSQGKSLEKAATIATRANTAFDLARNLGGLVETGALGGFQSMPL